MIHLLIFVIYVEIYQIYIKPILYIKVNKHFFLIMNSVYWARIPSLNSIAANHLHGSRVVETPYLLYSKYNRVFLLQHSLQFMNSIISSTNLLERKRHNYLWARSTRELSYYYFSHYIIQLYIKTLSAISNNVALSKHNSMLLWCIYLEDVILFYSSLRDRQESRLFRRTIRSGLIFEQLSRQNSRKSDISIHNSYYYNTCGGSN